MRKKGSAWAVSYMHLQDTPIEDGQTCEFQGRDGDGTSTLSKEQICSLASGSDTVCYDVSGVSITHKPHVQIVSAVQQSQQYIRLASISDMVPKILNGFSVSCESL
jgi:hypothetical protein